MRGRDPGAGAPGRRPDAGGDRGRHAGFWRSLASDTQLRWLGPEKGVIHLATAAVVNAVWDLWAKREGKPLWKHSSDMTPEQLVGCVDFRYIADALTPEEAIELLQDARRSLRRASARSSPRGIRRTRRRRAGSATATTRWSRSCGEALAAGFTHVKIKVGADLAADDRRAALIRRAIGPAGVLMMDANQVWDVDEAIASMRVLRGTTPGGSRSRRAPTTCSATPASAARSRRSASRPASTCRTA